MKKRSSGILLHVTSLPSPYGIGDLGPGASAFADFLADAGQSLWQVLPLGPTDGICGDSPYSSYSAFAGNTLLISPDLLIEGDLLTRRDLEPLPSFPKERCDYAAVVPYKNRLLERAYLRFRNERKGREGWEAFCADHASWLEDFALFRVIKKRFAGTAWDRWPRELRDRDPGSLEEIRKEHAEELEKERFFQYLFFRQWLAFKDRCNQKGIHLMGDLAIYVTFDSADVWAHPGLFKLDEEKHPTAVSGVPPDYFSKTGQLWGNPVYRWETLKETGYAWWVQRIAQHLKFHDAIRIDHFRGLVAYWEVPSGEETAMNGKWVPVPVDDFLNTLMERLPGLPLVAEDLGLITQDVRDVMNRFGFPGMKVLLFAFGEDHPMHPYLPHTYERNFLAYTGTHDNNTARGWFEHEATPDDRRRLWRYLGREVAADEVPWALIRLAMMSVADLVIVPMQDVLSLGEDARMNTPSVAQGNWGWRVLQQQMTETVARRLREMTQTYGRAR